uniref:CBFD_NFYB_HMF domain-containing protein n=1 Tax=Parastrongyloides trichosuri TaxID=131310 RepID=A0A0N4ZUP5_PARTI
MVSTKSGKNLKELEKIEYHINNVKTVLPLSRIKKIVKHIPDVTLVAPEVITAISYLTEIFVETLTEEACKVAEGSNKKTVTRKDIDNVIETSFAFQILENCIDAFDDIRVQTVQDDTTIDEDNDIEIVDDDNVNLEDEIESDINV